MPVVRKPAVIALVVWTVFVWGGRIANILRDDDLSTAGRIGRTALALAFTVLAVAVAYLFYFRGALVGARGAVRAVRLLALGTIFIWIFLLFDVSVFGSRPAGFKAVHAVIGVISIALGYLALRSVEDRDTEPVASG